MSTFIMNTLRQSGPRQTLSYCCAFIQFIFRLPRASREMSFQKNKKHGCETMRQAAVQIANDYPTKWGRHFFSPPLSISTLVIIIIAVQ